MSAVALKLRLRRYAPRPNHWTRTAEGKEHCRRISLLAMQKRLANVEARREAANLPASAIYPPLRTVRLDEDPDVFLENMRTVGQIMLDEALTTLDPRIRMRAMGVFVKCQAKQMWYVRHIKPMIHVGISEERYERFKAGLSALVERHPELRDEIVAIINS